MRHATDIAASYHRIKALVYKEFGQLGKNTSSFLMGIALPVMLILIKWEPHTRDFSRELGDQASQRI